MNFHLFDSKPHQFGYLQENQIVNDTQFSTRYTQRVDMCAGDWGNPLKALEMPMRPFFLAYSSFVLINELLQKTERKTQTKPKRFFVLFSLSFFLYVDFDSSESNSIRTSKVN